MGNGTVSAAEALSAVVVETLEKQAFLEPCPAPAGRELAEGEEHLWSRVELEDPPGGEILLVMPAALVRAIAGLACGGSDAPGEEELLGDTVGELLNTMAGGFMERMVPGNRAFTIGFPVSGRGIPPSPPGESLTFLAEGRPFLLRFRLAGG
jgi:hypothetical protein